MKQLGTRTSLLHAHAGPKALHVFTAYVFGIWALKMLVDPVHELAHLPNEMVEPVGIVRLFPAEWLSGLLSETGLWGLKVLAVACCLLSMIPRLLRFVGPPACLALAVHQSLVRSFGNLNHGEIALLLATYVLVLFAWYRWGEGTHGEEFNPHAVPHITVAGALTLAYSFVGLNRLVNGGLYIFVSDTLLNFIQQNSLTPKFYDFGVGDHVAEWPSYLTVASKAGFMVTTVFEVTAPLCLISRGYRYLFFAVMVPFHAVTLVTMEIFFYENLLLYVVLVDCEKWWFLDWLDG